MNELTLEEVIDKIDNYLTESKGYGRYTIDGKPYDGKEIAKKYNDNKKRMTAIVAKIRKVEEDLNKYSELASKEEKVRIAHKDFGSNNAIPKYLKYDKKAEELEKLMTDLHKEWESLRRERKSIRNEGKFQKKAINNAIDAEVDRIDRDNIRKKYEKGVEESTSDIDLNDDINSLKLRIYEAYDEGIITESDKDLMLEYLNLDNYEEAKESFYDYIQE